MSKEKQIEEIKLLLESTCDNTECNYPFNCDLCQATRLYNEGYRKQSEGEWIAIPKRGLSKNKRRINYFSFTCPMCGRSNGKHKSNYCPECGANLITKPKGGGE